jgi:hypothetical protein
VSEQNDTANDYALAKYLNERVAAIFALVADHRADLPDLTELNRSYVLLVSELRALYGRNPELSSIGENICWRTFETIDAIDPYTLYEYSTDHRNHGIEHISKVNGLCIVAGKETPDISPELQKILDDARINAIAFAENWLIPEYTFEITESGRLLVNGLEGVMSVNKVNTTSTPEIILSQAKTMPNRLIPVSALDLGESRIKRGIRTALIEIGFTGALEQLFLPVMDNQRGVKFRPHVTRAQANSENINLSDLDRKLKSLGAETVLNIYGLSSW